MNIVLVRKVSELKMVSDDANSKDSFVDAHDAAHHNDKIFMVISQPNLARSAMPSSLCGLTSRTCGARSIRGRPKTIFNALPAAVWLRGDVAQGARGHLAAYDHVVGYSETWKPPGTLRYPESSTMSIGGSSGIPPYTILRHPRAACGEGTL